MSIFSYSTTPGANTSVDGVNIAEGMPPGNVNNAMRAMMADTRKWQIDTGGGTLTGGTGNAYTLTTQQDFSSYANGMRFSARVNRNNTGAATMNVNGVGAVQMSRMTADGLSPLSPDELRQGGVFDIVYSTGINGFVVLNALTPESTVEQIEGGVDSSTRVSPRRLTSWFAFRRATNAQADNIANPNNEWILTPFSGLRQISAWFTSKIATIAQAQAGTNNDAVMTPLRTAQAFEAQDSIKAWGNFNGSNLVIRTGKNFASVSRINSGRYTITFTTPMQDANYAVTATCSNEGGNVALVSATASQLVIQCKSFNANQDAAIVGFQVTR